MAVDHPTGARLGNVRFDVLAAVAGLILAIALLPLRLLANQIFIELIPLLLGGACALYLYAVYRDEYRTAWPALPAGVIYTLPGIVILGLAALVLLVALQGTRSRLFFVVTGLVGTLMLVQILFAHERDLHAGNLLFQVVCFALVFRLSALYVTPGLIGVDAWTHITVLANGIYEEESLGAIATNKHYTSPLYHLLTVAAALLYDLPLRLGLYLSLGIVVPISVLLVYATTSLLLSVRWAVLAAALYAIGDYVAQWGMHIIPTSLGLIFFLGVLYFLVRIMRIEFSRRDYILLVVLSIAVVFTHQVSTFIMLIVLGTAFLSQIIFKLGPFGWDQLHPDVLRAKQPVNMLGLLVFDFGLTIFAWSLTPFRQETFLATVLSWFHETLVDGAGFLNLARPTDPDNGDGGGAGAGPTLLDQVVQHIEVLGFLVLLGLCFAGCLYIVHRDRTEQSVFTLLLATAIMIVFVLGLPMFGIRNFIPGRWFAFLYAPLIILGVVGLRYFAHHLGTGTVVALMLVIALIYPMAMVLASPSNADNPVFPNHHEQLAYSDAELAAVATIERMSGGPSASDIRPDQVLYTDHPYQTVFRRTHAHYSRPATVIEGEPSVHQVTVYRSAQSSEATFFRDANERGHALNIPEEQLCRPEQATIYTNGEVTWCTPSPATS